MSQLLFHPKRDVMLEKAPPRPSLSELHLVCHVLHAGEATVIRRMSKFRKLCKCSVVDCKNGHESSCTPGIRTTEDSVEKFYFSRKCAPKIP